jgi:hypothetical protein
MAWGIYIHTASGSHTPYIQHTAVASKRDGQRAGRRAAVGRPSELRNRSDQRCENVPTPTPAKAHCQHRCANSVPNIRSADAAYCVHIQQASLVLVLVLVLVLEHTVHSQCIVAQCTVYRATAPRTGSSRPHTHTVFP